MNIRRPGMYDRRRTWFSRPSLPKILPKLFPSVSDTIKSAAISDEECYLWLSNNWNDIIIYTFLRGLPFVCVGVFFNIALYVLKPMVQDPLWSDRLWFLIHVVITFVYAGLAVPALASPGMYVSWEMKMLNMAFVFASLVVMGCITTLIWIALPSFAESMVKREARQAFNDRKRGVLRALCFEFVILIIATSLEIVSFFSQSEEDSRNYRMLSGIIFSICPGTFIFIVVLSRQLLLARKKISRGDILTCELEAMKVDQKIKQTEVLEKKGPSTNQTPRVSEHNLDQLSFTTDHNPVT
ncbi:hypothetical protein EDD86DRAFT_248243 [Gorgonomyces haynaldii]|nr:hypothetical protein EDD86DRAFT_248243 [Gorgonomyces haynaldii]